MRAGNRNTAAEAEIRALKAIRAPDVDGSRSGYASDALLFDVVNPLGRTGPEAARKRLAEWSSSFQGPNGYDLRDLSITRGDHVAFAHGLKRVSATSTDGRKLDMWWRATICYRRIDGTDGHARACVGALRRGERPRVAGPRTLAGGQRCVQTAWPCLGPTCVPS